jgi:hypothetical protein
VEAEPVLVEATGPTIILHLDDGEVVELDLDQLIEGLDTREPHRWTGAGHQRAVRTAPPGSAAEVSAGPIEAITARGGLSKE